jgi:iron complex outermembrane receptor protein
VKSFSSRLLLLATSALSLASVSPALAQDASDDSEIVVTARRTEERLQDVPISITVLNQEQLSDRNVVSSTDLATYTPSLAISSRYGVDKATFGIRGFSQDQATSATVGVYFADVVAVRGGGPTSAGDGVGPGNFFDLQNVQILKGPQGTLFGRNTTGGAILLVPQRPESEFGGYYEMSLGNYDMHREQAVLNVPVADNLAFRFGVDHQQRDGYLENHSGIGPSDFGDVNYTAVRLSALWDVTPNLENYTVYSWSDSSTNGTLPRLTHCDTAPPLVNPVAQILAPQACLQMARQDARGDGWWDVENSNPDAHSDLRSWQLINTTTWDVSDSLSVKWISGYGEFRESSSVNIDGDNLIFPAQFVLFASPRGGDNTAQGTLVQELQFQGQSFGDRLSWQAGLYYEHSEGLDPNETIAETMLTCTDRDNLQCTPLAVDFGPPFGIVTLGSMSRSISENEFETKAIYAQGSYDITDQLTLSAGIRYTWDTVDGYNENLRYIFPPAGNPPGPVDISCNNTGVFGLPDVQPQVLDSSECRLLFHEESNEPTWTIDLEYSPTDDLMLYGKYSRGYRQGSILAANPGFETWGPEQVDTYEIGAKTSFDGPVSGFLNIAAFYNDFTDMQIQASALGIPGSGFSGGSIILNAGAATIYGVEIDSSLRLLENLRADLGYAYLNTELEELDIPALFFPYASITPTANVGGPLAFSPENRFTGALTYTLPLDPGLGDVSVGVTYVWTDEQQTNAASPFGMVDATELINLNVNWDSIGGGPLDFSFFVTNLTEEEFVIHTTASYNSAGFEGAYVNEPRMIGARLRARFGAEAN